MPRLAFVPTTLFALTALCSAAQAQQVMVTATVTNLAPANSISFAPLHVGFGNGSFDAFNIGQAPGDAIVSVAEGGAGVIWQSAFAAAEPGAVRGTIGGLRLPGSSASMVGYISPEDLLKTIKRKPANKPH